VTATAQLRADDDLFTWDIRRIGQRLAWCLDLTVLLKRRADAAVRPVLQKLISTMRQQA
jgi:hypothetical protein